MKDITTFINEAKYKSPDIDSPVKRFRDLKNGDTVYCVIPNDEKEWECHDLTLSDGEVKDEPDIDNDYTTWGATTFYMGRFLLNIPQNELDNTYQLHTAYFVSTTKKERDEWAKKFAKKYTERDQEGYRLTQQMFAKQREEEARIAAGKYKSFDEEWFHRHDWYDCEYFPTKEAEEAWQKKWEAEEDEIYKKWGKEPPKKHSHF